MSQINFTNTQFAQFVNYANSLPNASESTAIVTAAPGNADGAKALADRAIVPKTGDYVGKIFRNKTLRDANDEVRTLFKAAVAEMFGGEDNIPASVKSAMKLGDYGKGKPLTARRIIAVNNAIEKLKVDSFTFKDAFAAGKFEGELTIRAEDAGHKTTNLPKLSIGANLLAKATGMPLRSALLEVMDKSSAAYAAVQCGPLYTGSVADFKKGMEIQKEFKKLQTDLTALARRAVSGGDAKDYADIARIRVEQLKIVKQQFANLFAMQTVVDMSCEAYTELMEKIDSTIHDFKKAAKDVADGLVEGEANLYARTVGNKKMVEITAAISNKLGPAIHRRRNDGDPKLMAAISGALRNISEMCVSWAHGDGIAAFDKAFAERETPKIEAMLHDAETKGGFKLPKQFYASIGVNLERGIFERLNAFNRMADKLVTDSSKVIFSDNQKSRLKAVIASQAGNETAAKLIDRFVTEIEATCCQHAIDKTTMNEKWDENRIEDLVAHFEKNPGLAKAFVIGFKEDRLEEVKADLKKVMCECFESSMTLPLTNMRTLEPGFMPLAIREYNKGYVTFNGKTLPDGVSGRPFQLADSDARKGYCEFLEEKFDSQHVQMRRLVSFVCGMSDGLSGAINTGAFTGTGGMTNNPDLVKSPQRSSGYYENECKGNIISANRDKRDNYDIRIDDKTGDVTIKFPHYETTCLISYTAEDGKIVPFAKADKNFPDMATTRMEVTMVITNKSDDELGDKIPDFNITEIKQEVV